MAQGHPPAAAMASYRRSRLPFARPQTLQTLQTLQKSARPAPQGKRYPNKPNTRHAPNAPNPPKATTRPQQWLNKHPTAAAMASIGVPKAFARPQTLQTLDKSAQLRRPQKGTPNKPNTRSTPAPKVRPTPQGKGTPTSPTGATPAGKSHHKATAMAQGHPPAAAMASYRRSRLPFARPQTLQTTPPKVRPAPQGKGTPTSPTRATVARTQKPPQGHSNGSRAPPGRSNGFSYRRSRLPFARPQTLQTSKSPPSSAGKGTPTSPTRATPAGKSHHKATAMAEGHPPAAAMASYRRSRLPFARPQTLKTLQKSAQLRIGLCCTPTSPTGASRHASSRQAKATTRPQQWLKGTPRPQQWRLLL